MGQLPSGAKTNKLPPAGYPAGGFSAQKGLLVAERGGAFSVWSCGGEFLECLQVREGRYALWGASTAQELKSQKA